MNDELLTVTVVRQALDEAVEEHFTQVCYFAEA